MASAFNCVVVGFQALRKIPRISAVLDSAVDFSPGSPADVQTIRAALALATVIEASLGCLGPSAEYVSRALTIENPEVAPITRLIQDNVQPGSNADMRTGLQTLGKKIAQSGLQPVEYLTAGLAGSLLPARALTLQQGLLYRHYFCQGASPLNPHRHSLMPTACVRWRQAPPRKRVRVADLPWPTQVKVLDEGARVALREVYALRFSSVRAAARKADVGNKKNAGHAMEEEGGERGAAVAVAAPSKPRGKAGASAGAAKGKGKQGAGPKGRMGAGPKGKASGAAGAAAGASRDKEGAPKICHNPRRVLDKELGSDLPSSTWVPSWRGERFCL